MGGDSPNIVMPQQPSYSEALSDSLRAQVDLLRGTGEFDDTGGLRDLVREYEAPLRQETAQVDTDVLRRTLLGTTTEAQETEVTYDDQGRVIRGYKEGPQYQVRQKIVGRPYIQEEGEFSDTLRDLSDYNHSEYSKDNPGAQKNYPKNTAVQIELLDPDGNVVAYSEEKLPVSELNVRGIGNFWDVNKGERSRILTGDGASIPDLKGVDFSEQYTKASEELMANIPDSVPEDVVGTLRTNLDNRGQLGRERALDRVSVSMGEGSPIYARDEQGEIIQDPAKAGLTERRTLPAQRNEDGMIDLLGDSRNITETRRLSRDERGLQLVEQNPELSALYEGAQNDPTNPFYGLTKQQAGRKLLDDNEGDLQKISEEFGIDNLTAPEFANVDTGRQAGFDEQGNFLGLAALAEDVQAGNLSRQRERDLADVERLSDRFRTVMEDYKPETSESLKDARSLIQSAGRRLGVTPEGEIADAEGIIDIPQDGTYGGDALGMAMRNVLVDQAPTLDAATTYNQSVDPLRQALLTQAQEGLNEGLTDRERSAIEQASRARQVASGRIFDPTATVQEAQAVIQGDRNRLMQNRAFAQSALGQEAGLQDRDLGRGLQQDQAQAGLDQQRNLAQAQIRQQAAAFGGESALRAALANQAQRQQAAQFDVGARLDAQTRDEELRQRGLLGYIDAVGRLAQIEDDFQLDPFSALLGRGGGGSLQAGQGVFGQAGYGLQSGPQYLNPEAGLSYISNRAANQASMYGAQVQADATRTAGLYQGIGAGLGGAFGMFNFG